MAGFLTPLDLRELDDGRRFEILAPFEYCLGAPNSPRRVIIPQGFVTDFASIPRVLWSVLPPNGRYGKAAVVHDWLYTTRRITILWPYEDPYHATAISLATRARADHILLEAMQVLGVGWWTRSTIYAGVRTGGWHAWNEHRKQDMKG